jgi:hypothetical protein
VKILLKVKLAFSGPKLSGLRLRRILLAGVPVFGLIASFRPALQRPQAAIQARAMNAGDPTGRPALSAFRKATGDLGVVRSQQIGGQQPLQMLLSMRLFCSRIARSSGVVPDDCETPGRGTVSPVDVR